MAAAIRVAIGDPLSPPTKIVPSRSSPSPATPKYRCRSPGSDGTCSTPPDAKPGSSVPLARYRRTTSSVDALCHRARERESPGGRDHDSSIRLHHHLAASLLGDRAEVGGHYPPLPNSPSRRRRIEARYEQILLRIRKVVTDRSHHHELPVPLSRDPPCPARPPGKRHQPPYRSLPRPSPDAAAVVAARSAARPRTVQLLRRALVRPDLL